MTRSERLDALTEACGTAGVMTCDVTCWPNYDDGETMAKHDGTAAGHHGQLALDHLAALEQAAIDAYLAEVPLPAGWTEERVKSRNLWQYRDTVKHKRIWVDHSGVMVLAAARAACPIPLPVLLRAAVQCHRLREKVR